MLVRELGEFGLIERLSRRVSASPAGASNPEAPLLRVRVGIGDDAAVWDAAGASEVLTTDTIVEGAHFTLETTGWNDLGWKALATNLSDVAAMGAAPGLAVVTLGLPPDTRVEDIDALYDGMLEAAETFGANVAGGDVVASPTLFITVALSGALAGRAHASIVGKPRRPHRRDGSARRVGRGTRRAAGRLGSRRHRCIESGAPPPVAPRSRGDGAGSVGRPVRHGHHRRACG